jgi:uridine kinase
MNEYDSLLKKIASCIEQDERVICAIDGPCASGKTTLGQRLHHIYGGNLIHMDDFFLQAPMRTPERLSQPGGNIDHERFYCEVLTPLVGNNAFSYRPYCCTEQKLGSAIHIKPHPINIIEGAYSLHPQLQSVYNIKVFLTVDDAVRLARLTERNPALVNRFVREWIPLEKKYFCAYNIKEICDYVL